MGKQTIFTLAVLLLAPVASRADDKSPGLFSDLLPRVTLGLSVQENHGRGGVIVHQLTPDGPAARAGLKVGDAILRISNVQIDGFDELISAIAGHKPGDQLTFTIMRGWEPMRLKVTLGSSAKDGKSPTTHEGCHSCPFLGVLTVPATAMLEVTASRLGLTDDRGLVVIDVVPGSPAAKAGLRHGDVIRSVDGTEIDDSYALRNHVKQAGAGKEISLTMQRGDATREVKVTPTEGPCDVFLFSPRTGGLHGADLSKHVDQLQQRIDALEKRIKELESRREFRPEK